MQTAERSIILLLGPFGSGCVNHIVKYHPQFCNVRGCIFCAAEPESEEEPEELLSPRIVAQQCWGVDAETSRGHRRDSLGCIQASQVPQAFIVAPACCCSSVMISDIVAAMGFLCQRLQVVACCEEVLWCFSSSPRSSYSLS